LGAKDIVMRIISNESLSKEVMGYKGLDLGLWAGIAFGPLAWAADEQLSYALTYHACSTGAVWQLHLISVVTLLVALSGAVIAWNCLQALPQSSNDEGGETADRSHFMAIAGMVLSLSFSVLIVAAAIPRFVLSPCH
jgi:hypothetical protein